MMSKVMSNRTLVIMLVLTALLWGLAFGLVLGRGLERDETRVEPRWIVDEQTTTVVLEEGEVDCVIHGSADEEGVVRIELIRCGEGRGRGDG